MLSLQEHADYSQLSVFRGGAGAHQQQQQLRVALATASPSAAPPAGAAGGDDDPPSSQRTQTMANELGELFERFDTQLRSPAPRSPAAAPRSPAGSLRSPGAALRSPSARSTSRFSAAIEPADPVTATGARAHERDARAEQLGAIAQQKLAQQLARVEGELDSRAAPATPSRAGGCSSSRSRLRATARRARRCSARWCRSATAATR